MLLFERLKESTYLSGPSDRLKWNLVFADKLDDRTTSNRIDDNGLRRSDDKKLRITIIGTFFFAFNFDDRYKRNSTK